jgi:uncharacterized protein
MSARHKEIVEQVNAAFARNDVEGFLTHCTDDFVWTMVGDKPLKGKDAIRRFMASGPGEPPTFSVDTLIAEGDVVVAQGDMTMKENGTPRSYSYCDVWHFRGDQLASLKAFMVKTESIAAAAGRA